jgi:hypothetical protein
LTGRTVASESLRPTLATVAKATAKILESRGLDSVGVGDFTGPPAFGSSYGPGIRLVLVEELGKLNVREKKVGAAIGIQGRYTLKPHEAGVESIDGASLRIEASLVDISGQVLTDLNTQVTVPAPGTEQGTAAVPVSKGTMAVDVQGTKTDVKGSGALGETLGATVDLDSMTAGGFPNGDTVIGSFQNPTATIRGGTAVAASKASPFSMEILVGAKPRSITLEDGQPFVALTKGDAFQIRFTNRANYEAAVTFALDGVGSFQFSDVRYTDGPKRGQPKYSRWIVPRGKSIVIKGWHRTNETVDEFLVTDFASSAASKLGSVTGLGTITATVRATWRKGERAPEGEPMYAFVEPDVGIGQGQRIEQRVKEDVDPREYGQPRAVITVRYTKPK